MSDKYGSRKFLIASTSLALGSLFLGLDKLTGGEWVMLVAAILGLYGAGNVMERKNDTSNS